MATRTGSGALNERGVFKYTWTGLQNGDVGVGITGHGYADKTVQATGTFGTGGKVEIEGSNDGGQNWGALHDPQGTPISLTASAPIAVIAESPELVRPRATGDGTTSLSVHLVATGRK